MAEEQAARLFVPDLSRSLRRSLRATATETGPNIFTTVAGYYKYPVTHGRAVPIGGRHNTADLDLIAIRSL